MNTTEFAFKNSITVLLISLVTFTMPVHAIPTCDKVLTDSIKTTADLKQLLTLEEKKVKKQLQINSKYEYLIEKQEKIISDLQKENSNYKAITNDSLKTKNDYDKLIVKYKTMAKGYRDVATSTNSNITFDIGLGTSTNNNNSKTAALVGISFKSYKLWGFFQDKNTVAIIGKSFQF